MFGLDRWRIPETLQRLPACLSSGLPMPAVPMHWLGYLDQAPLWFQPLIQGDIARWSAQFAEVLGCQCAQLERARTTRFGSYMNPAFSLEEWPRRLQRYLADAIEKGWLPPSLNHCLPSMPPPPVSCAPLLLDMRNDQFMFSSQGYAWIDWEAMVWAPVDFSLSLYEITVPVGFSDAFLTGLGVPSRRHLQRLHQWRPVYRAALSSMGVLGEVSFDEMMTIPFWLDRPGSW